MSILLAFMLNNLSCHASCDILPQSIEIFQLSSRILYANNFVITIIPEVRYVRRYYS